jgi:LAO/AO transport system kinase
MTPGAGDEVQMMKAGILEAADIFVINKADKEGADVLKTYLKAMLEMKSHLTTWQPDIILTEAVSDKGTAQLVEEILRHKEYLISSDELAKRRKERARFELMQNIGDFLRNRVSRIEKGKYLERLVDSLVQGKITPYAATLKVANRLAGELRSGKKIPESGQQ